MNENDSLKKIISHCKAFGFIFQSSEIYDGLSAVYDYGPLGVELKNNLKTYWWKSMINLERNIKNKNLKEVVEQRMNLDYEEYKKIKNYSIQSTLRNLSATANLNLPNKYIYVYAQNYFSSLSEKQLNGQNYKSV